MSGGAWQGQERDFGTRTALALRLQGAALAGLMRAWRKGNVAIANAPGAGVADDKVVYAFVPAMIRFYLDQAPILPNVETYLCMDDSQRDYVLKNLDKLVVKPANESGGYGMLVGPAASKREIARFREKLKARPGGYMASIIGSPRSSEAA